MLQDTEIENWNSLFPNCQIRTSDLRNPTEYFLTKALVAYLRKFGYKVEPPTINFNNDNNKEYRAFLIKLARHTDHMLKICRKALSFTYYDLISPTPKKTSQTLSVLLNYLVYYNWFKDDVFNMARGQLNEYKELKAEIEENKQNNERLHKINVELQEAIKNLEKELPKVQTEYDALKEKALKEKARTEELQETVNELIEKELELKEQKEVLRKNVVTDEESQELQLELKKLKEEISDIEKQESSIQASLIERDEIIKKGEALSKDIQQANNIVPKQLLEKWKLSDDCLERARSENRQVARKRVEVQNNIEELQQKKQTLQNLIRTKKDKIKAERKKREEEIAKQKQLLAEKNETKKLLQDKHDQLQDEIKELHDIEVYLHENIRKIQSYAEHY